jgi:integrase
MEKIMENTAVAAVPSFPAKRESVSALSLPPFLKHARHANVRTELLLLAERVADPSLKSDLERLADLLLRRSRKPSPPSPPSPPPTPLTEREVRRILYIAKSRPEWKTLHALLLLIGCGGISCDEMFKLRRDDVVLDRGKPRINIAGSPTRRGPKPSRTVTLPLRLAEAAETLLERSAEWGSCLPEHFVLIRQTSKYGNPCDPMRPGYIRLFRRRFDDVRLLANLPHATWRRLEISGRIGVVEC